MHAFNFPVVISTKKLTHIYITMPINNQSTLSRDLASKAFAALYQIRL